MNTTSLITDYIISGVLGILAFLVPYLMIDSDLMYIFLKSEVKNETILTLIIAVIVYSFGVIYNQIADFLEEKIFALFRIKIIETSEDKVKTEFNFDHHYALQLIVCSSETAYNYISFRRTMIRIIRAFLSFSFLLPIFHIVFIVFMRIYGVKLIFSSFNIIVLIISCIFSFLAIRLLIKLYKGYYSAIINFAQVIIRSKAE